MNKNREKQELFFKVFELSYQGKPGELEINSFEQVIDQQLDIHRGSRLISCIPIIKDGSTTQIILIFES